MQSIPGIDSLAKRTFSMYDVEQFLRDAGADRVNERAVVCLEKELKETADHLVELAAMYANHAGRNRIIKRSDVMLARGGRHSRVPRRASRGAVKRHPGGTIILRHNVIGVHGRPMRMNAALGQDINRV